MKLFLQLLASALAFTAFAVPAADQPPLTATTLASGLPRAPEQEAVSFELADLSFKVDPARKWLDGDATLTFLATKPISRLVVDLDRNYRIDLVEVDGVAIAQGAWRNPEGRMSVDLPKPLVAGSRTVLRIRYAGSPHEAKRAPWDGGIVWAKAPTGEPWIATAVEGEGCDLLWPCIDHPMGEPLRVDQHITVPAPLVAAGNGIAKGMDEKDGWRIYHWSARNPDTYAIALNIGPYELLQADYHSRFGNIIPMRFWYLKGNEAKAHGLFAEFTPMLDFFEETVGPYPWGDEKMGVVETPHLGMEHQTINAYGNGYKKDVNGYDWLLHHELSHEWFGNQVTNADWGDLWLHEGFGMYMQPLYLQWLRGDANYFAEMLRQRAMIRQQFPMISGHSRPQGDPAAEAINPGDDIYFKGAWILHTLRNQIGDKAFLKTVRELVYGRSDPKPGNFHPRYATTSDYIAIVNQVTGRDWNWFFDVYLRQSAMPKLLAQRDGKVLRVHWEAPGDKPFPLPVQVRVGDRVVDLAMVGGHGETAIAADESWTLDPHSRVLRDAPEIQVMQRDTAERAKAAAAKAEKGSE
ncbi:M1 family metallopeptidase [Thermomonas sp.]|uniref:M1 family metallopeptidase n=1 Tax=Thermomonas sp. TaxID=1971895 RepID=UPI002487965B|nr:M1 family metallopeptidase [Thermomonas sp.]MDI1253113.1 M1 family metallopeptidase [Thermomonas sp.]